tara:strand:+ start:3465 stop:4160 length:696 start_codon:yes stop_codon:yes gene_type:complete
MNASIVIPCYNEEENIHNLFSTWKKTIEGKNIEVIFVNNGSQDKSQDIFTELQKKNTDNQIKVLNLKENKGYGGGIQEGLKIANGDILSWCHADNQVSVLDIISLIEAYVTQNNEKFVIKGRRRNRSFFDNFFTKNMGRVVKFITGFNLTDINAQPKVFSKKAFDKNKDYSSDFLFDLDFLLNAIINGFHILEKNVTNLDREFGQAKGGGTFVGKIKLSIKTLSYLIEYKK